MIIGISGKARSGKDTVANFLVEEYGFLRIGFADAVKEEVKKLRLVAYDKPYGNIDAGVVYNFVLADKWRKVPENIYNLIQKRGSYEKFEGLIPEVYRCVYDNITKKEPELLQWWGTDVRRKEDINYWIRPVRKFIKEHKDANIVIPDVRFINEAEFVKATGGQIWRLNRVNKGGYEYISDDRDATHASEVELDDYNAFDKEIKALYVDELLTATRIEMGKLGIESGKNKVH